MYLTTKAKVQDGAERRSSRFRYRVPWKRGFAKTEGKQSRAIREMYFAKDRETRPFSISCGRCVPPSTSVPLQQRYIAGKLFHTTFTILFYFEGYIYF